MILDKEFLNSTYNKVWKIMKNSKVSLMSRYTLNRNEIIYDGFTIKWNDTELDKDEK